MVYDTAMWPNWIGWADTPQYRYAVKSGTKVVQGVSGYYPGPSITSAVPINLHSGWFTSGSAEDMSLTVNGYLGNALLCTRTVVLNGSGPQLINLDFCGVDSIGFVGNGFIMDDLSYDFAGVPEPSSLLALAGSLGCLTLFLRRHS